MKEEILVDIKVEQDQDTFTHLAKLKTALIHNQEEVNRLKTAYKNELITQKEFATEVVRLEANQKKLNATYNETQQKITGLKSPFDRMNQGLNAQSQFLDKLIPGLGSTIQSFNGMATSAKALQVALGPVAWVLAAIAATVGLLTAAVKTNDSVADDFEATWAAIKAVLFESLRTIGLIGQAISEFAQGNFSKSFHIAADAVNGFDQRLALAAGNAYDLTRALQALEDETNTFNLSEKALENTIAKLVIQSKNRSLSEAQRIALNQQADKIETELTNKRIALAIRGADIILDGLGKEQQIRRKVNETLLEYGTRLIASGKFGTEGQEKIVKAVRSVDEALSASIRLQEKLQNQRDALIDAAKAKREKEEADFNKSVLDAESGVFEAQIKKDTELTNLRNDNIAAANKSARQKELEAIAIQNAEIDAIAQRQFDKEQKAKIAQANFIQSVFSESVSVYAQYIRQSNDIAAGLTKGFIVSLLRMFKKYLEIKVVGESFATPDSILTLGVTGALRAAAMVGIIEAAFVGAEGIIQGFNEGGRVTGGRPIKRSNGDNVLITARKGEAVLTETQQRIIGHDQLSAAGVPGFNWGGRIVTDMADRNNHTNLNFNPLPSTLNHKVNTQSQFHAMYREQPVLFREDFERFFGDRLTVKERTTI